MLLAALAGTSSSFEMANTAGRQIHACNKYRNGTGIQHWPETPLSRQHPLLYARPMHATIIAVIQACTLSHETVRTHDSTQCSHATLYPMGIMML